jgi:hypothetical protein
MTGLVRPFDIKLRHISASGCCAIFSRTRVCDPGKDPAAHFGGDIGTESSKKFAARDDKELFCNLQIEGENMYDSLTDVERSYAAFTNAERVSSFSSSTGDKISISITVSVQFSL